MRILNGFRRGTALAIAASLLPVGFAVPSFAAEDEAIEEVVVIGSRRQPRSVTDSAVPIDVISGEDFISQGNTDMDNLLRSLIPSYNVNAQPISDAATIVRPANLRGLPPDSTLILVNGKRRHRSAVISFLGGGISDGSQGPDLSVIPGIALKQVEVLRDGASAQYGSDAIAGVLNFVLRDDPDGGSIEARWGQHFEGDGATTTYMGNIGLPLTDAGFANFSFEYQDVDPTSRSIQRGDAANLISVGNSSVANPAQIWGSPLIDGEFKLFGNAGLDLGNNGEAYIFGNWADRTVDGGFFFRNPNTRGGVFSTDGGSTIAVADLTFGTADDGVGCPVVNIVNSVPNPAALAAVAADPNCFAFNELFPGGFTPRFGGTIVDTSITGGTRGSLDNGWLYDVSASVGRSDIDFAIRNTVNPNLAPLGVNMPTSFRPGSYVQTERSFNVDVSKGYDVDGFYSPLNLAAGIEYREEIFEIKNGDPNSFAIDPNIAPQGFGIGSNGFPGFKPADAGKFDRSSYAAYVDLEADVTDRLLLGAAIRFEDFSDFGTTTNGKFVARFQVADEFALRGAVSTGFRAPTIGQSSVRNVTTAFTGGVLADEATLPPTNPISVQKGGRALQPEESVNLTVGAIAAIGDIDITIDYFNIEVEDRIALTTTQVLSQDDISALLALGVNDATSFTGVRFFTNDFDTTTQGIDIVATMPLDLGDGDTKLTFVYNWTDTSVDSFNPTIIGPTRVRQLEDNLPETRYSVTGSHVAGMWRGFVRFNYFGEFYEAHLDDGGLPIEADGAFTVDAEVALELESGLSFIAGAQNIFDEYPDDNPWASIVGAQYPLTSPFGFNGGYYYLRGIYNF